MRLSLCMIVKNEEAVLARCLESVKDVADEIVIVDTGSSDATGEIAARYTDRLFSFAWEDDFSAARNFAFSKAGMEYTMWLDADDVVDETNRQKLLALKKTASPETDMFLLRYDAAFDEKDRPTLSYYRERIVRTLPGVPRWVGAVHEVIPLAGKLEYRDIAVCHRKTAPALPGRNLRIYEKLLAEKKALDARQQYYYAREFMDCGAYRRAAKELRAFLRRDDGWTENQIGACLDLAYCFRQLSQKKEELDSLLASLRYAPPRAEACCALGQFFLEQGEPVTAIFWYEMALSCPQNLTGGGFCRPECYGFLPWIQLCLCFDQIGEYDKAEYCNRMAGSFKPESSAYLHNLAYFESRKP